MPTLPKPSPASGPLGRTVLLAIKPVLAHVPLGGVWLLLAGGLCYTAGVIFFAWERLPFNHAI